MKDSPAHEHWNLVVNTTGEEESYCRMIGSLGLSPYIVHPEIDRVLEKITTEITETMLTDLCDATTMGNFERAAEFAKHVSAVLASVKEIQAKEFLQVRRPADTKPRAYEWGYQATDAARSALGIAHDDPSGSTAFFERLQLDPSAGIDDGKGFDAAAPALISGAVERMDENMRVAVAGSNRAHRKFAAARATFLAWSDTGNSSRLVTTARTRDQQASRAFAAELLAPARYLEKRLGERSEVSAFTLDKLSEEMGIAPTIVHYQARNHGYYVAEAA